MALQFLEQEVIYNYCPQVQPKDQGVYTMYHGTSVSNARSIISNGFRRSTRGMLGPGVYVSRDRKKAERYPLNTKPSDRVVLELHVRVGRVKRIDQDNHPMQYTWNAQGYDTAWVPPNCGMIAVPSGLEEDCVFDPKRVKVVGIAKAPVNVLKELQQLVANSQSSGGNGDSVGVNNMNQGTRVTIAINPSIHFPSQFSRVGVTGVGRSLAQLQRAKPGYTLDVSLVQRMAVANALGITSNRSRQSSSDILGTYLEIKNRELLSKMNNLWFV